MSQSDGFALLCDAHGSVTNVLNDSPGMGAAIQPGMPFARLAAPGDLGKSLTFLIGINAQGACFNDDLLDIEQVLNNLFCLDTAPTVGIM